MRELLERLCALNAVSSWEDEVRAFLLAEVEPHADRLRVDALGNLIAWKKGRKHTGSKLLLTAHMDEVGLMIRQITDDGYLKFDTVGAIDRRVLLGKPVLVGPKRVPGVVGLKAYHLVSREEEKSVPKLDEFYIDIGARDRAGAEAQVALGDTAAFDSDAGDFGAGLLQGKALGSRLGCAVLLTLLRDELPMDCTFVFTAQKEVGARGAFGAAFSVTPEVALVVDGADAADLAGVPAHKQGCSLGGGVVLPYMDQGAIADRGLFEALRFLAEAGGIPWQTMRSVAGRTDTAAIQELMSRVSAGNKPFKGIEPTLTETENDMANENKTQGFEYGAIAASLGMKDGEVKDVMARISELAAMEPKYREIQKSLSDAQTVIAGKDASIRNLQTDLAAATARLSAYEQKEKDEQASRIETLVENAIAEGKIDREAKTQWVEMAGSNFELAESTLASIPAREKISKEIADDPANIQATAEATKTAEQLMAEKVAEVVGADFKFRKL